MALVADDDFDSDEDFRWAGDESGLMHVLPRIRRAIKFQSFLLLLLTPWGGSTVLQLRSLAVLLLRWRVRTLLPPSRPPYTLSSPSSPNLLSLRTPVFASR